MDIGELFPSAITATGKAVNIRGVLHIQFIVTEYC